MSSSIQSVNTLSSTLRISKENATSARGDLDLPEANPLDRLKFDESGFAAIKHFSWCYMGSTDMNVLRQFAALTEGDADLVFLWDGGWTTGAQIRSGVVTECDVAMTLVPKKAPGVQ